LVVVVEQKTDTEKRLEEFLLFVGDMKGREG
jgi:hypothetical protein